MRTSDQYEIDLLLEIEGRRWAIETKLTSSPSVEDLRRTAKAASFAKADRVVMVSRTAEEVDSEKVLSTNIEGLLCQLDQLLG